MAKSDNPAEVGLHVFERADLGKAPFRCDGYSEITFQAAPGEPVRAGGSCDYCGTGIRFACHIRSRDGRSFKVGTDCVAKTNDAGLIRSYKTLPAVRAANRDRAKAKDDAICAEWTALIEAPATIAKLSVIMVPGRPWIPGDQVSRLDNMKRVWGMCGASGRARTLKTLKMHIAEPIETKAAA